MLLRFKIFKVTGKDAQASLGRANITCNKNGIPFDTESPLITSGIRLGTLLVLQEVLEKKNLNYCRFNS